MLYNDLTYHLINNIDIFPLASAGRYSTFSIFALDVLKEFYHINGFPTKSERMKICKIIGETEKRVQVK